MNTSAHPLPVISRAIDLSAVETGLVGDLRWDQNSNTLNLRRADGSTTLLSYPASAETNSTPLMVKLREDGPYANLMVALQKAGVLAVAFPPRATTAGTHSGWIFELKSDLGAS